MHDFCLSQWSSKPRAFTQQIICVMLPHKWDYLTSEILKEVVCRRDRMQSDDVRNMICIIPCINFMGRQQIKCTKESGWPIKPLKYNNKVSRNIKIDSILFFMTYIVFIIHTFWERGWDNSRNFVLFCYYIWFHLLRMPAIF